MNTLLNNFIELCEPISNLIQHKIAMQHSKAKKKKCKNMSIFQLMKNQLLRNYPRKKNLLIYLLMN